jgi:hypothetical protein
MASMAYHKDVKRWRVFWHVTVPDGTVDSRDKKPVSSFDASILPVLVSA